MTGGNAVAGSGTVAGDRPRPRSTAVAAVALPVLGALGTVALWWLAIVVLDIESYIVPTPAAVAEAFTRLPDYLLQNAWVTLQETLQGFGLTVLAGILIGAALSSSTVVERAMYPVLVALNAVPKLAFAPLLIVWMGFGQGPKVVMVVLMCFFPIVLATATGLTSTAADLVELSRSLSASRWQTFVKVRLHAAMPQIFVGLKTAMPLAVIGALVGELFGATEGLGFVIQNAGSDTAVAFAAIALLALMSIVLFYALVVIERFMLPWVRETTA
jgi:NitT/TauT family transport system permease protein